MTTVLNFFGGPGIGKSTTSARLFAELKTKGVKCELITEFAKDLTWENRMTTLDNQLYVLAKQHHKMFRVYDKVDYIVTDSPLLLSLHYGQYTKDQEFMEKLKQVVLHLHNERESINFFIERTKEYQQYGRAQTAAEAKAVDANLKKILLEENIPYHMARTGPEGLDDILKVLDV